MSSPVEQTPTQQATQAMSEPFTDEFNLLTRAQTVTCVYGWQQNEAGNKRDGYCAVGALARADQELWGPNLHTEDGLFHNNEEAYYRCRSTLDVLAQAEGFRSIVGWNDKPGRTKHEVLTLFAKAALKHA